MEGIKLKHLPSFIRTTDADDLMVNFAKGKVENARDASALLFDTIDDLEHEALEALSPTYPPIFAIGPLQLLLSHVPPEDALSGCLEWLDTKEPNSVVYVNFGSVTVMTDEQLVEFASDLANSKMRILWVMRPDLIIGESPLSLRILFSKPRKGLIFHIYTNGNHSQNHSILTENLKLSLRWKTFSFSVEEIESKFW
ncbi:hypothetical protein ACOSQ2_015092 [Xanthoceras sorbifolium]